MSGGTARRDFLKLAASGAAALGTGLAVAPGARPAQAAEPRTLTVAWDTDIDTLDPASFKSIGAYTVQANIYDSPLMWKVDPVAGSPGLYRSKPEEFDGSVVDLCSHPQRKHIAPTLHHRATG